MLPTEAIERIRILSERGLGSKAIAKSTGITRNTVRKYLTHIQQKKHPLSQASDDPANSMPTETEFVSGLHPVASTDVDVLIEEEGLQCFFTGNASQN